MTAPCQIVEIELTEYLVHEIDRIVNDGFGGYRTRDEFVRMTLAARISEYDAHKALVLKS